MASRREQLAQFSAREVNSAALGRSELALALGPLVVAVIVIPVALVAS